MFKHDEHNWVYSVLLGSQNSCMRQMRTSTTKNPLFETVVFLNFPLKILSVYNFKKSFNIYLKMLVEYIENKIVNQDLNNYIFSVIVYRTRIKLKVTFDSIEKSRSFSFLDSGERFN